jgi:hypothetical protein
MPCSDVRGSIVCYDKPRARKCSVCKKNPGSQLCDGRDHTGKTCDRRMCRSCCYSPGDGHDYCRDCALRLYPADVNGWIPQWLEDGADECFKRCGRYTRVELVQVNSNKRAPACHVCCSVTS